MRAAPLPLGDRHPAQHVAVEVDRAALVAGHRDGLLDGAEHAGALVGGDQAHAGEAAPPEPGEELLPGVGGLRVALRALDDLPLAGEVDAYGDQDGHVLVRAAPAALEVDAVDEQVGVVAVERAGPPGLDGGERPLVEVGDGAGGDRGSPQDLGHVLDAPGGDPGQVHLDDRLLDARLAPAVALDHGGLEGRAAQLGDPELDLSAGRDQLPLVVPAAVGLAARRFLVAPGADELGRLLVEQRVYGVLDGLPHQIPDVPAQRLLVD